MTSLKGKRIFISRDESKAYDFMAPLKRKNAEILPIPLISFKRWDVRENAEVLKYLSNFSWIVFTSANGVIYFFETLKRYDISLTQLLSVKFAVVGVKTKQVLKHYGFNADFIPKTFDAENFSLEFIKTKNPNNILLVKGNLSRTTIDRALDEKGIDFQNVYVYQTVINLHVKDEINQLVAKNNIDAWVFTSPSSLHAFKELTIDWDEKIISLPCFCIGETTKSKAEELGFKLTIVPEFYTLEGLAESVICFYS